jgi:hypothetical protein
MLALIIESLPVCEDGPYATKCFKNKINEINKSLREKTKE